jgi:hypothetical protein
VKTTSGKTGFKKISIAYLILASAAIAYVGSYGWQVYAVYRDAQSNMPKPQVEKLIKDFRLFHSKTKRFPANFTDVNNLIWHTRPVPDYGANGRQARTKNYYYFYTRVNDGLCTVWAIPLGPRREYGSTFFLVISTDWVRSWQGKAIDESLIAKLPAIPSPDELIRLELQESPARVR